MLDRPWQQCFVQAHPLRRHTEGTSNYSRISPRRRRERFYACATPPETHATLTNALSTLDKFSGTKAEARALTVSLLDSVTAELPDIGNDPNKSGESITPLYKALGSKEYLKAFATACPPTSTPPAQKAVSVRRLVSQAGLPLSALAPKKSTVFFWQLAGVGAVLVIVQGLGAVGLQQYSRSVLFSLGALFVVDQVGLRGMVFEGVYRKLFPQYEEKVLTHEAGHFLAAYLHGLPVRGYVLSAAEALMSGIPGQAGTMFSDDELFGEMRSGRLTNRSIDRFSIVAMAGIAAEAIYYGEAEGGESDVSDLIGLLTGLEPAWSVSNVRGQARWAVLEAIMLLRRQEGAFEALREAMRERKSLGECILRIEEKHVREKVETTELERKRGAGEMADREQEIVSELERIRKQVSELEMKSTEKR